MNFLVTNYRSSIHIPDLGPVIIFVMALKFSRQKKGVIEYEGSGFEEQT